jgi:hypothetical protein
MPFLALKDRESTYPETPFIAPNGRTINKFLYKHKVPRNNAAITNFITSRIITNEDLAAAASGEYTWILRESGNFYAAKAVTKQEVGSLHINLDMFTKAKDSSKIIAAGELKIIPGQPIEFNLLSGTYMAKNFEKLNSKGKIEHRNNLVTKVINTLIGFGIPSKFAECTTNGCSNEEKVAGKNIIETANIKTSNKNLANFNKFFNRSYGGTRRKSIRRGKTMRKNRR